MKKNFIFVLVAVLVISAGITHNNVRAAESPNLTFSVKDSAGALMYGALIKIYSDFPRTNLADNQLKVGSGDATEETAGGAANFKLTSGSYEYEVQKLGYNSYYGSLNATDAAQTINVTLSTGHSSILSPQRSGFIVSETSLAGNGMALTSIEAYVRTNDASALSNRAVTMVSNRGDIDKFDANPKNTLSSGKVQFFLSSSMPGIAKIYATVGGVRLETNKEITFTGAVAPPSQPATSTPPPAPTATTKLPKGVNVSDLVKSSDSSAVYYVGRDEKRHAFPNEKIYLTWYSDFSSVKTIGSADLASLPLGKNVTYKPGIKMLKLQTIPKVYAVARGSVLRWIQTESIAQTLYGADWNQKIDDLNDAFFTNYVEGEVIDEAGDFYPSSESASATIDDQLGL